MRFPEITSPTDVYERMKLVNVFRSGLPPSPDRSERHRRPDEISVISNLYDTTRLRAYGALTNFTPRQTDIAAMLHELKPLHSMAMTELADVFACMARLQEEGSTVVFHPMERKRGRQPELRFSHFEKDDGSYDAATTILRDKIEQLVILKILNTVDLTNEDREYALENKRGIRELFTLLPMQIPEVRSKIGGFDCGMELDSFFMRARGF